MLLLVHGVLEHLNAVFARVIKMLQLVRGLLKAFELVFLLLLGNPSKVELDAQVVILLLLGNPNTLELRVELRDAFRVALLELRDAFRVALLELILLTIHLILFLHLTVCES